MPLWQRGNARPGTVQSGLACHSLPEIHLTVVFSSTPRASFSQKLTVWWAGLRSLACSVVSGWCGARGSGWWGTRVVWGTGHVRGMGWHRGTGPGTCPPPCPLYHCTGYCTTPATVPLHRLLYHSGYCTTAPLYRPLYHCPTVPATVLHCTGYWDSTIPAIGTPLYRPVVVSRPVVISRPGVVVSRPGQGLVLGGSDGQRISVHSGCGFVIHEKRRYVQK